MVMIAEMGVIGLGAAAGVGIDIITATEMNLGGIDAKQKHERRP